MVVNLSGLEQHLAAAQAHVSGEKNVTPFALVTVFDSCNMLVPLYETLHADFFLE